MMGLRELRQRSGEGECPFCGDPLKPKEPTGGRAPMTCGDEICRAAYHRFYKRDQRLSPSASVELMERLSYERRVRLGVRQARPTPPYPEGFLERIVIDLRRA